MTIEVLFSDVDRTLLTHDHVLPEPVRDVVLAAGRRGIRTVLASARSPVGLRPVARRLGAEGLAICFNGAWIGDLATGRTVAARPLAHSDAVAALEVAAAAGIPAIAYGADAAYARAADAAAVAHELAITGDPLVPIPAPRALDAPVFKVMGVARTPDARERFAALRQALPDALVAANSAGHLLEIVGPGVSKGAAVAEAAAVLGVERSAVAAAGDAENDLGMLAWAAVRLSVANGCAEARALADHVGRSCDEGGIADGIRWLRDREREAGQRRGRSAS